jgi:hypothetical protein
MYILKIKSRFTRRIITRLGTEIANAVIAAGEEAQYDIMAKKLLSHKHILAHILVAVVDEFKGMEPKDVIQYIEGDPYVNVVPVESGMTNKKDVDESGKTIVGMNTEDSEINELLVRFDIIFYVRMRDGIAKMIINVEAQKKDPTDYDILNRATFYVCRMVSSQKDRDFSGMKYNDILPVYSIWICMNMNEDSLNHYHVTNDVILGNERWKGKQDVFNIVMIGLAKKPPKKSQEHELHRLLRTLLSKNMPLKERFKIFEEEYNIPMQDDLRRDVSNVSNLGQGLVEETIEETNIKHVLNMHKLDLPVDLIAKSVELSEEEVKRIIEENSPAFV